MKPTLSEVANAYAWAAAIIASVILLHGSAQVWILLGVITLAATVSILVLRRVLRRTL
ncbi:MAG: hypothetical protein ACE5JF_10090 [Anaerolineales bacterium]